MEAQQTKLIPYDRMKEQIEKEIVSFANKNSLIEELTAPKISFEKGSSYISFAIPFLSAELILNFLVLIKDHLVNIRIHSFDTGYYAFQALNSNLFKTDNILDNIKIEFTGITSNFKAQISKKGDLTQEEINLVIEIFKTAHFTVRDDPIMRLKKLGASVFTDTGDLNWSYIAGYEEVKRKIRESIIMPLQSPEVYDSIARLTRRSFESNRPRAILFEGSPGVGKTTVARLIAGEVNVPLIYVPIESIMSKWYGQSAQNLSSIFNASEDVGGSIVFLDEIDALAGSRDQSMFEATRRVLSVLLRRLDGIDSVNTTITIGATNRKKDLDHALISRFDQSIYFPLPNEKERAAIFSNYAKHLTEEELSSISALCDGLSGRNIKDICELAERRWARKLIIDSLEASSPGYEYYRHAARIWIEDSRQSL